MSRYRDLMELADFHEKAAAEAEEMGRDHRRLQQEFLRQALEVKDRK